jgi:hypothetical protein
VRKEIYKVREISGEWVRESDGRFSTRVEFLKEKAVPMLPLPYFAALIIYYHGTVLVVV